MRRSLTSCLLVAALFGIACYRTSQDGRTASQHADSQDTERTVLALEDEWTNAQRDNTALPLNALLADNFVDTSSDGTVRNKAETIAGQNTVKFTSIDIDDSKVHVFGDTAIVTGVMNAKATEIASGKPFEIHERNTDTWVKMPNGHWQCVATQQTTVQPALSQGNLTPNAQTRSTRRE